MIQAFHVGMYEYLLIHSFLRVKLRPVYNQIHDVGIYLHLKVPENIPFHHEIFYIQHKNILLLHQNNECQPSFEKKKNKKAKHITLDSPQLKILTNLVIIHQI